jgi:hypothetical protein
MTTIFAGHTTKREDLAEQILPPLRQNGITTDQMPSEVAVKVEPEVVGTAQAAAARYLLDGERAFLEQLAGGGQALGGEPAKRRGAGFGEEPAGEGPLGHVGVAREVAYRHGRGQTVLRPGPILVVNSRRAGQRARFRL